MSSCHGNVWRVASVRTLWVERRKRTFYTTAELLVEC